MSPFEPKIIAFLCDWCAYSGGDLAGTYRVKMSPNVRPIRVMCSGRVDPTFVLKAFSCGADGVIISGCYPGDCHYAEGNYKALRRTIFLRRMLREVGIDPRRLRLEWISASEGEKFAHLVDDMTETIRRLGPFRRQSPRVTRRDSRGKAHEQTKTGVLLGS